MSNMQTRLLVIHNAAGGARVVLRTEAMPEPMPALARSLPVVDEDVRSVEPGPWAAGEPGCYACGVLWVAIWPLGTWNGDCLECPRCGTFSGKLPDRCWCAACGHAWRGVLHPEAADLPLECPACHRPRGMVETG